MIRLLIADDHPSVRHGLRLVLSIQNDIALVGEAADGEEAVRLALRLRPDVIMMDLKMPIKGGPAAIAEIRRALPEVRMLVLTSGGDDASVLSAIAAGALSFVLKDASSDQIVSAVRSAYCGESVLHPTIARKVLREFTTAALPSPTGSALTACELEVLQGLAQGFASYEIAAQLSLSADMVAMHVRNILHKLHLAYHTPEARDGGPGEEPRA